MKKFWSCLSPEDKDLFFRILNENFDFVSNYENAQSAADAVVFSYDYDPSWFDVVVDDIEVFRNDCIDYIEFLFNDTFL